MKLSVLRSSLLLWFAITFVWGTYRYLFLEREFFEELLIKPLIFIVPVLIYLKLIKKLHPNSLGLHIKNKQLIFGWGGLFGLFLVTERMMISLFIKHEKINYAFFSTSQLVPALFVSLSTAVSEELLFRGFLLPQFMQRWKSEIRANIAVSLLFSLTHLAMGLFVLQLTPTDLFIYMLMMFLLGFANGFMYQRARSVAAPIASHALWNFTNNLFISNLL